MSPGGVIFVPSPPLPERGHISDISPPQLLNDSTRLSTCSLSKGPYASITGWTLISRRDQPRAWWSTRLWVRELYGWHPLSKVFYPTSIRNRWVPGLSPPYPPSPIQSPSSSHSLLLVPGVWFCPRYNVLAQAWVSRPKLLAVCKRQLLYEEMMSRAEGKYLL